MFFKSKTRKQSIDANAAMPNLAELQHQAHAGNANAARELGWYYDRTLPSSEENRRQAVIWYQRAYEQGDWIAAYLLGCACASYEYGCHNSENACRYFFFAAQHNSAMAMCSLGLCLLHGYGTQNGVKDEATAVQCFQAAINWNYNSQDDLTIAHDGCVPRAMYHLAKCFESGIGCEQNLPEARRLYTLSARMGFLASNDRLSLLNSPQQVGNKSKATLQKEQDFNIPRREWPDAARRNSAAANNHPAAQFAQAHFAMFDNHDYDTAIYWAGKAAAQNFVSAQNLLGLLFSMKGRYAESAHWYKIAANNGSVEALYNYAKLAEEGRGTSCNPALAFQMYQQAAAEGCEWAQQRMGDFYSNALHVPLDNRRAEYWYTRALEGFQQTGLQEILALAFLQNIWPRMKSHGATL